jgi:hypothetical protein
MKTTDSRLITIQTFCSKFQDLEQVIHQLHQNHSSLTNHTTVKNMTFQEFKKNLRSFSQNWLQTYHTLPNNKTLNKITGFATNLFNTQVFGKKPFKIKH